MLECISGFGDYVLYKSIFYLLIVLGAINRLCYLPVDSGPVWLFIV